MSSFDLVALLLLLAAVLGIANQLWFRLPRTIGVMAGALAVSVVVVVVDRLTPQVDLRGWWNTLLVASDLPHVFLDGVLAFMLFAGSLNVDMDALRDNKWTVLALATVGTLMATIMFAAGIYFVFGQRVPVPWCVVLGAILAPTDPIAVAGLLRRVGLPAGLQAVIAGESLFNDGVAVVVFSLAATWAQGNGSAAGSTIALQFLQEAMGGAALGLLTGYVAYRALKLVDEYHLELTISLALVTGTYSVAHALHLSGPIAVVVAGLLIGYRATRFAMSDISRVQVETFWELVDELLNAVLFLLLGFTLLSVQFNLSGLAGAAGGIVLAVLVRLVSVALPSVLLNLRQLHKARGIAVLTWGGLRGGISVALVLSLAPFPWRGEVLTVCYAVVVFTILVQGLTMPWLIARLYPPASLQDQHRDHHGDHA
ncbi:MAG: sodium:proton antiporter [Acetobacteraceae bacterium]|nr:sodium:proton antiporter [Acetobacteraceae bacterium]